MPIDPITGALILRGAQTGAQLLSSAFQKQDPNRPRKTIPESMVQATNKLRQLSNTTQRPGRDYANRQIRQGTSTAVSRTQRTASNPAEALQAIGGVQAQENEAMAEQQARDDQFSIQAERDYINQLRQQGRYEEANERYNKLRPYEETRARKEALLGAGVSNLDTIGQDIASYELLGGFGNEKEKPVTDPSQLPGTYLNFGNGISPYIPGLRRRRKR